MSSILTSCKSGCARTGEGKGGVGMSSVPSTLMWRRCCCSGSVWKKKGGIKKKKKGGKKKEKEIKNTASLSCKKGKFF